MCVCVCVCVCLCLCKIPGEQNNIYRASRTANFANWTCFSLGPTIHFYGFSYICYGKYFRLTAIDAIFMTGITLCVRCPSCSTTSELLPLNQVWRRRNVQKFLSNRGQSVEDAQLQPFFLRLVFKSGSTVVKVLRYKSEGRWFVSRFCLWNFSLT